MTANPLPYGQPLPDQAEHATVADLLRGRQEGWQIQEGRKVPTRLGPVRLVQHFRSIGACGHGLGRPLPAGGQRVSSDLLKVLHLALAERGWLVAKKDVLAAWWLASLDPQGPEEANSDPF
jgi:hypothetical protein